MASLFPSLPSLQQLASFLRNGVTVEYVSPDDESNRGRIVAQPDGDVFCKGTTGYYETPDSQAVHLRDFNSKMTALANDAQTVFRLLDTVALTLRGLAGFGVAYPLRDAAARAWSESSPLTLVTTFLLDYRWWMVSVLAELARACFLWWAHRYINSKVAAWTTQ